MTQREALNDDRKKLNWLLGLEKETLADMAHQQSKIIEKLQKAAKARAVPQWIPVSERLPPSEVPIDVYAEITAGDANGDTGRLTDCFYNAGARMYWCWSDGEIQPLGSINVTHWMPLPAAPEQQK